LASANTEILADPAARSEILERAGIELSALGAIGASVHGLALDSERPPSEPVRAALEHEMAVRGFLVFKSEREIDPEAFLAASCWWGGRQLHSTHGVHPATPGGNRHIFRLSNDQRHGIPGVGPQWHNDGSFLPETFSHSGYHIVRPAERGGGTHFAHQADAHDALDPAEQERWARLVSVNSNSGVLHPLVHAHPLTGRRCVWLHLGMTGGVIERQSRGEGLRLLDERELGDLCRRYDALLNQGFESGYAIAFEYEANDCVFIDNLAVAHRAAPQAHASVEEQGLRIMHRSTVQGIHPLTASGLPSHLDIHGPSPLGEGVWQGGGIGFRWDAHAPMQN